MKGSRVKLGGKKLALFTLFRLISLMSPVPAYAGAWWSWDQSRDYIIGGVEVPNTDIIASTTVAIISQTDQGTALCTGSIIDTDLIVTAGHCVGPSPDRMRIVFRENLNSRTGKVVRVTGYVRDPNYGIGGDSDVDLDDIALIRFDGGLPAGYQAATLLSDSSQLQDGSGVTLAGYGITTGTPRKGANSGAGILREVDTTILNAHYGDTEVEMDQSHGKGACHGDSGGPAFLKTADGNLLLFGVTSRGPSNVADHCDTAGIYTNILAHLDFIQSATDELRSGDSD
jgi:secreted trypsin-like serine protease